MDIYVITLKSSLERQEFMKAQFDKLQLKARFVEGVDGKEITTESLERDYDAARNLAMPLLPRWRPHPLYFGQIGCALSKLMVYRMIAAANNGPALILEDDAVLSEGLPGLLRVLTPKIRKADVVLLYHRAYQSFPYSFWARQALGAGSSLFKVASAHAVASTVGYIVTPNVAERMARTLYPVHTVSDHWGYFAQLNLFDNLAVVVPRPVLHGDSLPSIKRQKTGRLAGTEAVRGNRAPVRHETSRRKVAERAFNKVVGIAARITTYVFYFLRAAIPPGWVS